MKTFKKLILDDLKKLGYTTIISKINSIKSRQSSVDVYTTNLLKDEREKLDEVLENYRKGHFDGMHDIYEYKTETKKEMTANYLFIHNTLTQDIYDAAKKTLLDKYDIVDDKTAWDKWRMWYDMCVNRVINER